MYTCRVQRHNRARESMNIAQKLLVTVNSVTSDHTLTSRQQEQASAPNSRILNLRLRANSARPKTTFFSVSDDIDVGRTSNTINTYSSSGDHVISYPQLVSKSTKTFKEKKKVTRSATFRNKKEERKEDKEREKQAGAVLLEGKPTEESSKVSEQLYVSCITALKASLEEIIVSL